MPAHGPLILAGAALGFCFAVATIAHGQTPEGGGYAPVNGLRIYYEIHGSGTPLVLLHGGLGSTGMFDPILPALAKTHRVIAVDLQAHGRTADIDRPFSFPAMADDVAGVLRQLGVEKADVMGYSLGGGVAFHLAARHPELVRKLVLVSIPFRRDGWYPEVVAAMAHVGPEAAEPMKQSPIYQLYARVAPRPDDWPGLLTKMGDLLRQDYDWSADIAKIPAQVLLVYGDADAVRPEHMVEFYQRLGGGKKDAGWDRSGMSTARLAILPGVTHYDIFMSPALAATVLGFIE